MILLQWSEDLGPTISLVVKRGGKREWKEISRRGWLEGESRDRKGEGEKGYEGKGTSFLLTPLFNASSFSCPPFYLLYLILEPLGLW